MDTNYFNPNNYNVFGHLISLEKQVYNLNMNAINSGLLFQKMVELNGIIDKIKEQNINLQNENKEIKSKLEIMENNLSSIKKTNNYIKKKEAQYKKEITNKINILEEKNMELQMKLIDIYDKIEKKIDENDDDDESENSDDEFNNNVDGEERNDNDENQINNNDSQVINNMMDSIINDFIKNGKIKPNGGGITGSIIMDAKTGKIINTSFNNNAENDDTTLKGLNSIFSNLLKPKSKDIININNYENELELQNDFSKLEKYEVENIDIKLNNLSDLIILTKKYPIIEDDKNEKKMEKVDGLYEYNGKYYGINLETLSKLQKPLEKLDNMIGLSKIKNQIMEMILYYIQEFEKGNSNMLHTIIEGPPGVGKTELGKIFAEIYASLGIIASNKFKLVKRTDLIGEYVGHTAHKTQNAIDEAEGGVLFIDEAYSLGGGSEKSDTFSKECIDVLNQNLSENKKKLIVIIAGYPEQLETSFFSYNPGLKRRFPFKYSIEGYSAEEMKNIYLKKIKDINWKLDKSINEKYLIKFFSEKKESFKNYGGDIENFILNCKFVHSKRVFNLHPYNRQNINKEDFENGFERLKLNKKVKEDYIPPGLYI